MNENETGIYFLKICCKNESSEKALKRPLKSSSMFRIEKKRIEWPTVKQFKSMMKVLYIFQKAIFYFY